MPCMPLYLFTIYFFKRHASAYVYICIHTHIYDLKISTSLSMWWKMQNDSQKICTRLLECWSRPVRGTTENAIRKATSVMRLIYKIRIAQITARKLWSPLGVGASVQVVLRCLAVSIMWTILFLLCA